MTIIDNLLVLAFAILYPLYAFFVYRRIKSDLSANKPGVRVRDYRETIAWLWAFAIAALVAWWYQDRSLLLLGLGLPSEWPAWLGLLLVAMLTIFLFLQLGKLAGDEDQRQSIAEQLSKGPVTEFLPRTQKEMKWFLLLSITAGICEEILFRGFLIWYFQQVSNTAVAVILSSVLFGVAHSYQGIQGGLRAGIMGLVVALSYIFSGSLWVPVFLHIVGDIYSGKLGYIAFGEQEKAGA